MKTKIQDANTQLNSLYEDIMDELSMTFDLKIDQVEGYSISAGRETGIMTVGDAKYLFILEGGDAMRVELTESQYEELIS